MVRVIILRYQITDVNCKTNASCKRSIVICFIIYHMSDVMKDFREEKGMNTQYRKGEVYERKVWTTKNVSFIIKKI